MPTIFSRIIAGEIPGTFVWSDDICVAFMSINPINHGHTLVVPRFEVDQWTDLPRDVATHLMAVSHTIGSAQKRAFDCNRIGMMIVGFEVPHVHIHLIPASSMEHFSFRNAAITPDFADIGRAADAIRSSLGSAEAVPTALGSSS